MRKTELNKYNPQNQDKNTLELTFIGREEILAETLKSLELEISKKHHQHIIFTGPRGIGKTNLLCMIYYKVKDNVNLSQKYIPIQFSEEEYGIANLKHFFIRIIEQLSLEDNIPKQEIIEKIMLEEDLQNASDLAYAFLKDYASQKGKVFILLIDNLDIIFSQLSNIDLKKLRSILMNDPYILIYAGSITLFGEFININKPFYQLFRAEPLLEFKLEDYEKLLWRWIEIDGKKEAFEKMLGLKLRIKALYKLTGGNPRLLLILYHILSLGKLQDVVYYLNSILDDQTPFFQDMMKSLSPQHRLVIDIIAKSDSLMSPTEIGKKIGMKVNQVTANISKLVDLGYLHPRKLTSDKKSTFYELNEKIFRIWYQMRTGGRQKRRIQFLIEFLCVWYSREELEKEKQNLEGMKTNLPPEKQKEIDEYCGYISEALRKYDQPKQTIPNKAIEWFDKGNTFLDSEKHEEALNAYEEAIKIEPNNIKAWINKGIVLGKLAKLEDAIKAFDKAIEINPNNFRAWSNKGFAFRKTGRYEEAIKLYEKAIEIKPDDFWSWGNKGLTLSELGKYEEAIKAFEKVIEIKPDNFMAWTDKGKALSNLRKYEEAVKGYEKAIEINSNDFWAWNGKGFALRGLHKYEEAIKAYEKAIEIDSNDFWAWNGKGIALISLGKREEAIESFWKVLGLCIKKYNKGYEEFFAEVFTDIFELILKAKRYDDAQKMFQSIKNNYPDDMINTLYPIEIAIEYFVTGNKDLIERQPSEFRDIIEEIIKSVS